MRRSFSPATLSSLRNIPVDEALSLLAIDFKADPTYRPLKDPGSRRWHVRTAYGEFEILTTGPAKWYDTRAHRGGGGAIDLAMHLLHVPFVNAVTLLAEARGSAA